MQLTFGDAEGLGKRKQTRRENFLAGMDQVVPLQQLLRLSERTIRCQDALVDSRMHGRMLRIRLLRHWHVCGWCPAGAAGQGDAAWWWHEPPEAA